MPSIVSPETQKNLLHRESSGNMPIQKVIKFSHVPTAFTMELIFAGCMPSQGSEGKAKAFYSFKVKEKPGNLDKNQKKLRESLMRSANFRKYHNFNKSKTFLILRG